VLDVTCDALLMVKVCLSKLTSSFCRSCHEVQENLNTKREVLFYRGDYLVIKMQLLQVSFENLNQEMLIVEKISDLVSYAWYGGLNVVSPSKRDIEVNPF